MENAMNPFCYVAEKDGVCHGVTAGDFEVREFYQKYAGCTIRPISTRDEWLAYDLPLGEDNKP